MGASSLKTRLIAVLFAVGIFATLPIPSSDASHFWQILLLAQWLLIGLWAWSLWFYVDLVWVLWTLSWILGLLGWWKGGSVLTGLLLTVWAPWYQMRTEREKKKHSTATKVAVLLVTCLWSAGALALGTSEIMTPGTVMIPKYLKGLQVNDLVSCIKVEEIPWRFRPDNRKTRLILRDTLRLNTETKFSTWEIHQVMDTEGYVTYIFRRVMDNGQYESLVIKDNVYNRIMETAKGPKVVERQNLRTLINRPVLTFFHADGSTVTYLPGLAGRSLLTIQLSQAEGRLLQPVFLKGTICDRPEDEKSVGTQATGGTANAVQQLVVPPAGG